MTLNEAQSACPDESDDSRAEEQQRHRLRDGDDPPGADDAFIARKPPNPTLAAPRASQCVRRARDDVTFSPRLFGLKLPLLELIHPFFIRLGRPLSFIVIADREGPISDIGITGIDSQCRTGDTRNALSLRRPCGMQRAIVSKR
jgi:hypothetical protein